MRAALAGVTAALLLIVTEAAAAQTDDARTSCPSRSRFAPGPIVNGRHRQPTQREIETRLKELGNRSEARAQPCMTSPGPTRAEDGRLS